MTFDETHDAVPALRARQKRSSTAEYAAQRLRRQISDGKLPPGTRLREEALSAAFGVSRNTVREAFRLLAHERLLEHTLHRSVLVRTLTAYDVRQIYTTRRLVQPLGIDAALRDPSRRKALDERVDDAMSAAEASDWDAVGTADITFHRTLVAGCRSAHIIVMFEQVLAELRLAFLQVPDRRMLHKPYIRGNRQIAALLHDGDAAGALDALHAYLDDAEHQVLGALSTSSGPPL